MTRPARPPPGRNHSQRPEEIKYQRRAARLRGQRIPWIRSRGIGRWRPDTRDVVHSFEHDGLRRRAAHCTPCAHRIPHFAVVLARLGEETTAATRDVFDADVAHRSTELA